MVILLVYYILKFEFIPQLKNNNLRYSLVLFHYQWFWLIYWNQKPWFLNINLFQANIRLRTILYYLVLMIKNAIH